MSKYDGSDVDFTKDEMDDHSEENQKKDRRIANKSKSFKDESNHKEEKGLKTFKELKEEKEFKEEKESKGKWMDALKPKEKKGEKKGFLQKVGLMNLVMLLIAGIALIWIAGLGLDQTPSKKTAKKTNQTAGTSLESNPIYTNNSSESGNYAKEMEDKLTNILSKVEGIGKVQVMITISESKELVTLKDAPYTQDSVNENDGEGGSRISSKYSKEDSTVMITENGENAPYIIKEKEPLIKGVLVIAQGGNDATVKVNIVEAVEALFDLPVHKIKVMKMGTK